MAQSQSTTGFLLWWHREADSYAAPLCPSQDSGVDSNPKIVGPKREIIKIIADGKHRIGGPASRRPHHAFPEGLHDIGLSQIVTEPPFCPASKEKSLDINLYRNERHRFHFARIDAFPFWPVIISRLLINKHTSLMTFSTEKYSQKKC
jgi:hypothetical protein